MNGSPTAHLGVSSSQEAALRFHHVDAAYGPYRALLDLSFRVAAGSVKVLLGANGAGKSTVARVATGLLPPTCGTITIGGVDASKSEAYHVARLGVAHVPEGRGIFAGLTVEENLTLVLRQRLGRRRVEDAVSRVYDTFPVLREQRHKRGNNLSGGQQRLLSLAGALVAPPKLLVADELSLGLAPLVVETVYEGLRQIHEAGTALLIVEQQVDRVLELADEAMVLDCGFLAYDGPAEGARQAMDRVLTSRVERRLVDDQDPPDHSRTNGMELRINRLAVAHQPATYVGNGSTHE